MLHPIRRVEPTLRIVYFLGQRLLLHFAFFSPLFLPPPPSLSPSLSSINGAGGRCAADDEFDLLLLFNDIGASTLRWQLDFYVSFVLPQAQFYGEQDVIVIDAILVIIER